jgi:nucleotide-binding universal stress UspA family protein
MTDIKTTAREIASTIVREASPAGLCDVCIDDITAALLSARLEALEEAAKAVEDKGRHKSLSLHIESFGPHAGEVQDRGRVYIDEPFKSLAAAIRSLKGE